MQTETKTEAVGFRFPIGLLDRVKRAAEEDDRSATGWIVRKLKEALDEQEKGKRG